MLHILNKSLEVGWRQSSNTCSNNSYFVEDASAQSFKTAKTQWTYGNVQISLDVIFFHCVSMPLFIWSGNYCNAGSGEGVEDFWIVQKRKVVKSTWRYLELMCGRNAQNTRLVWESSAILSHLNIFQPHLSSSCGKSFSVQRAMTLVRDRPYVCGT